ncbi:MAG: FIST C-terminal domain-containing protein [Bacteroidia bacterium]|nr:FIST C-terminal domain-containing protein [Bacteroidia bacterium]
MVVSQYVYSRAAGWSSHLQATHEAPEQTLILIFGSRYLLEQTDWRAGLDLICPEGHRVMVSTSGEILDTSVTDESLVVTAITFLHTRLSVVVADTEHAADSRTIGHVMGRSLSKPDLQYVMVLSDGQEVNGTQLVAGLTDVLGTSVPITGGMAGDADRFDKTLVGYNEDPISGRIISIGFYGTRLVIGHGSVGGWDMFGPDRIITRSSGNILHELDGNNALDLYKTYLGAYAADLPGSALLFPLNIWPEGSEMPVTRTILSVDETHKTMTFAGDMPQHARTQFMKANFDKLIDGSERAAQESLRGFTDFEPELVLLISCVGRKLILGQRVEEEVEVVREMVGPRAAIAGFYSYGEISPTGKGLNCELHNQTMTVTTFRES